MNNHKPIPKFNSENEEREFWDLQSPLDFMEVAIISPNKSLFPNLKLSTETISLRLSKSLLDRIKVVAHKKDVPYQSLIKLKLNEAFGISS